LGLLVNFLGYGTARDLVQGFNVQVRTGEGLFKTFKTFNRFAPFKSFPEVLNL